MRKEKGHRTLSPIALLHNLILIDTRNNCDAGFLKVNHSGGVNEAHGEDFSFESLRLPVHPAGSIHLYDPYYGSWSPFMTTYTSEAYNWKAIYACFFVRISHQSPL